MAISKQEAAKAKGASIELEVAALEQRIDRFLSIEDGRRKFFDVRGVSPGVRVEIERRYRAAGWTVTYHSDQRDGDCWEFA